MFSARCPSLFEGTGLSKYYQNFESDSALFRGTRVKDTEAFCGRYVLKNPTRLFTQTDGELGIMLSSYGTVRHTLIVCRLLIKKTFISKETLSMC